MAAGKSGGSAGEITFLEGTSISAPAGGGMGKYRKVWPPGLRIFSYSHWVGVGGGGGGRGTGGRGLLGRWRGGNVLRARWVRVRGCGGLGPGTPSRGGAGGSRYELELVGAL